ncbi:hypothetical protein L6R52_16785 [Myxococcota bacterium]|nr:hypothetical protein [Myxococcota bacterium]
MTQRARDFELAIEAPIELEPHRARASGERTPTTVPLERAPHPVITPSPSVSGGTDGDDAWFADDPRPPSCDIDAELDELARASERPVHEELLVRLALAVTGGWLFAFLLVW